MWLLVVKDTSRKSHTRYISRNSEKGIKKVWDELIASDPRGVLDIQLYKKVTYGEQQTLLDGNTWDF